MRTLLPLLLLFIATNFAAAQPAPLFTKYYGASFANVGNYAFDVVQTRDGGYAFTGVTISISGTQVSGHFMLYKADAFGQLVWSKEISLPGVGTVPCTDANGYALVEMGDSSLVIAASCSGGLALVRTTGSGTIVWIRNYNSYGVGNEGSVSMCSTPDGGVAVCGTASQNGRILKFDAAGQLDWTKTYSHPGGLRTADVIHTAGGGFVLVCTAGPNYDSARVIRTDAVGNELWARSWNSTGESFFVTSVTQLADGGYVFTGGNAQSGGFVCKLNATGAESWWLPTPGYISHGIFEHATGNLYSFSWSTSYLLGFQKIAPDGGSILLSRTLGQATPQYAGDFARTADGGFILCGYGQGDSTASPGTKAILIKTDTAGNTAVSQTSVANTTASSTAQLSLYPNPATQTLGFENPLGKDGVITITDVMGKVIRVMSVSQRNVQIDISGLAPGSYLLMLSGEERLPAYYGRFIRQ